MARLTVHAIRALKGKRQLTQVFTMKPEEAAAAGIDIVVTAGSAAAGIRRAAPGVFLVGVPSGLEFSDESAIRSSLDVMERGADRGLGRAEGAGDRARGLRSVPRFVDGAAAEIARRTSLCVVSMGSGTGCDAQYHFAEVRSGAFPAGGHVLPVDEAEFKKFLEGLEG
jgi:hypothetical protein